MTILQKIALGLSIVSLIISTGAVIISYRAMRRSSKALKDTQEEALKITDMWT
jgi:CHASE3 domain sensor protein